MKARFGKLKSYYSVLSLIVIVAGLSAAFLSVPSSEVLSVPPSVPTVESKSSEAILNAAPPETASAEGADTTQANPVSDATITQAGDTINFKSLKIVNNEWGAPPEEKLSCAVYLHAGQHFGWSWDRLDPKAKPGNSLIMPIYPSIRIGGNHREQSNLASFPIKMGDLKSLSFLVDYNYPESPSGTYNLSYDMFLLDRNKSGPEAVRKAEIMIWLHATLGQIPETYKGDFTDGYNTYSLYSFTMSDGRLYSAFVMKGQPQFQSQHKVDVKKLLDNLNLDPNWYIPGVELGNEIVNGSGKIEISRFSAEVNGSVIEQ